jgi:hypothetical protein
MDNWEDNIINFFTEVQKNLDSLYQNWDQDLNQTINFLDGEITKWVEDVEESLEEATIEFNQFMMETETLINECIDFFLDEPSTENDITNEWDQGISYDNYPLQPDPVENPACVGCSNYHGHVYSGNKLICAMHPYGWENDHCPDWEKLEQ